MTTTATMGPVGTTTTLVEIKYTTGVTHINAPREKKNLIMKFHLNHQTREAIFSCADTEHVGDHQQRKVQFTCTSDDCVLHFDNPTVFGTDRIDLRKNEACELPVEGAIKDQQTSYWVTYKPKTAAAGMMEQDTPKILAPPVIVVP